MFHREVYTEPLVEISQSPCGTKPGFHTYLEKDDDTKHSDCGQQVGNVWKVGTVESLSECSDLVCASNQQVEESNDGSFELSTRRSGDSGG